MSRRRGGRSGERRGRMSPIRWGLSLAVMGLVLMLGALGGMLASSSPGGNGADRRNLSEAPDFRLTAYQGMDVLGGQDLLLSQVFGHGKPVVLNFWAGLCPPCRVEMPGFQSVYEERKDDFILLGVDIGPFVGLGSREEATSLVQRLGVTYPIAELPEGRAVQLYRVLGMPTTVFITADGHIYRKVSGAISARDFSALVDELLRASTAVQSS